MREAPGWTYNERAMLIVNATILTPYTQISGGYVHTHDGRVTAVGSMAQLERIAGEAVFDAQGHILAPGFVDLQINGAFGYDFTESPSSIWSVAARLPRYGVTSFLPTIITSPLATIEAAQQALQQAPTDFRGAHPLGLHLEGPFLNPAKKGAHNPAHLLLPGSAFFPDWSPASGVRLVTVAPELPGALDLIRHLVANDVVVSAGHSMASFTEANAAFAAGLRYGTHLFNAMPPLHHRDPGLIAALLADERASVGIIADGVHVHPALVDLAWRLLGAQRLTLVSDAMAALGAPPGVYRLGDQPVRVEGQQATLSDGTLAGSILSLDEAIRNLTGMTTCSLPAALQTVTSTPARLLGLPHKGAIAPGADADIVLLTPDLHVAATFVGGRLVYEHQDTYE